MAKIRGGSQERTQWKKRTWDKVWLCSDFASSQIHVCSSFNYSNSTFCRTDGNFEGNQPWLPKKSGKISDCLIDSSITITNTQYKINLTTVFSLRHQQTIWNHLAWRSIFIILLLLFPDILKVFRIAVLSGVYLDIFCDASTRFFQVTMGVFKRVVVLQIKISFMLLKTLARKVL